MPKDLPKLDIETIFQSLTTPYIVFAADDPTFTIIEENQAHASVAMVTREHVVGQPLLEAFPDTSHDFKQNGKSELLESIRRVIKTGQTDNMQYLKYDMRDTKGNYTTKYWSVTHHPIKDRTGRVTAVCQETKDITEEILIEQRLDVAENQLHQVLASSLVGTWFWDIKKEIITTDANLARMFGISKEKAAEGLPLERFIASIHTDDRKRVETSIGVALASVGSFEEEYRTVDNKMNVRWVIARGNVQNNNDGEPHVFSGIIIDITDRKRAELGLSQSELELQFMADSMPQLIWVTRPDGYHEYYNQQWYDYTGTKPGTTDGEGWNDLFHPDDQKRAQKIWKKSLKTGEPYEIEYRLYHAASDTYRWMIGRALPYKDEKGVIVKWYGTCTDIEDQKHATQIQKFLGDVSKQLSTSLDYETMLKKVTQLCVPVVADWCSIDLCSEQNGFEQVSVAHTDPKKIRVAKEYRKHNPVDIDSPTGLPNVIRTGKTEYYPQITNEMLEQYIEDPKQLTFMKSLNLHSIVIAPLKIKETVVGGMTFVLSDSKRYFMSADLEMIEELVARISLAMTNSRLYADSMADLKQRKVLEKELREGKRRLESRVKERTKQLQLTNAGLRDEISRRHEVEKELQDYSRSLARSNSELEDFAYVASHDLQEPLRKIQAFSNLLKSEYRDKLDDGAMYVDRMDAAAHRMSTLIQDLLAFSRISTKESQPERVDLNEIINDVLVDLETRIAEAKGTVKVGTLTSVMADHTHMRQLFQNLISNALKFHKPDQAPVVKISATTKKDMVEIRVIDNGIGFDEKYLGKIFAVFQRLHGRDAYEGTGIGLAVCRKIVERYGGTIAAESAKNEGATFILTLPKLKKEKA